MCICNHVSKPCMLFGVLQKTRSTVYNKILMLYFNICLLNIIYTNILRTNSIFDLIFQSGSLKLHPLRGTLVVTITLRYRFNMEDSPKVTSLLWIIFLDSKYQSLKLVIHVLKPNNMAFLALRSSILPNMIISMTSKNMSGCVVIH